MVIIILKKTIVVATFTDYYFKPESETNILHALSTLIFITEA